MATKKRELSHSGDKRLIRRDGQGRIKESDDVGKSKVQHVSTRRTSDGSAVRVVLTPISSGSLKRDSVERAVSKVLDKRYVLRAEDGRFEVKAGVAKRTLIAPKGDKRYVRRDDTGRFEESNDLGRSLRADVKKAAKKKVPVGQGDRSDQKRKR